MRGKPKLSPVIAFDTETYGKKNEFQFGAISTPFGDFGYTDAQEMLDKLCAPEYQAHSIYATNLGFDAFSLFLAVKNSDSELPDGWSLFDNGAKLIWVRRLMREEVRSSTGKKKRHFRTLLDSLNIFLAGVESMGKILQKISKTYDRHHKKTGDSDSKKLAEYYNEKKLQPPGCRCSDAEIEDDHPHCLTWLGKKRWTDLSPSEREEGERYCFSDARVTRKFMEWFNAEIVKLGAQPRMTAASTALDLFRRKYLQMGCPTWEDGQEGTTFVIPQPHWQCLVDSRLSYYGGRTEDYIKGTAGPVIDNDINSMYPTAMSRCRFPYPSPERFTCRTNPHESVLQQEGFAKCKIIVPYMHIPPLPWRQGPKLLFPTGELTGVWCHNEIRHALEIGCKLEELHWSYYTEKTFNPFINYVKEIFGARLHYLCPNCEESTLSGIPCHEKGQKCKEAMATEEVMKLFLNGLYGKFAQNFLTEQDAEIIREQHGIDIHIKKQGGTFKTVEEASRDEILYTADNFPKYLERGYVLNKAVPKLKAFMNPILSSYTTAEARVMIHKLQLQAMQEATVYYTDTDSLLTSKRLSFAVKNKRIGELQEGKEYPKITVIGPKAKALYNQDGKVTYTAKGIPGKSFIDDDSGFRKVKPRKDLFASLTETSEENQAKASYSRFLKVKEALARGLLPNEIVGVVKKLNLFEFPKRRVIGKPKVEDLTRRSFETRPWEVLDGHILDAMEA